VPSESDCTCCGVTTCEMTIVDGNQGNYYVLVKGSQSENYKLEMSYDYYATPSPCPDFDRNCVINNSDIVQLTSRFGWVHSEHPSDWPYAVDLNKDGIIDIFDLVYIANYFGCTPGQCQKGWPTSCIC